MLFPWDPPNLPGLPDNIYFGDGKVMRLVSNSLFYSIQNLPNLRDNLYADLITETFGLSFKGWGSEIVGLYRLCGDEQCRQEHENQWFEGAPRK